MAPNLDLRVVGNDTDDPVVLSDTLVTALLVSD